MEQSFNKSALSIFEVLLLMSVLKEKVVDFPLGLGCCELPSSWKIILLAPPGNTVHAKAVSSPKDEYLLVF